jgi:Domain of unknown function (DUF4145)
VSTRRVTYPWRAKRRDLEDYADRTAEHVRPTGWGESVAEGRVSGFAGVGETFLAMRFNGAELPPKPEDEPPDSTFPYCPCPRCGRLSNFTCIASAPLHYSGERALGRAGDDRLFDEQVSVLACQGCRNNIVVVEEELVGGKRRRDGFKTGGICQWRGVHWWPTPGSTPADPDVPQVVANTIAEGLRCLAVKAPRAAVVMFRGALAEIVSDKGSPDAHTKRNLAQQLEQMKADGDLDRTIAEWAAGVRIIGNAGPI